METPPATDRLRWLDAARGIGIVLVVYAHCARALFDVLPSHAAFQLVDRVIYAFHMPLFFLLAGLVSQRSLDRSRSGYVRSKLLTVVYPYFLWSFIYWALETLFRSRVNTPLESDSIVWILWSPIEHLWFLYVLFLCQLAAAIVWPRRIVIACLAAWCLLGPLPSFTVPALWVQFPWFAAGLLLSSAILRADRDAPRQAGLALMLAATFGVAAALVDPFAPLARVETFLTAGIGISLTLALATVLGGNRVVAYLGQASLSIYLLHTLFAAGVREFFEAVYPIDPVVLLAITCAVGLALPLALHEIAMRMGIAPYLGLGRMASTVVRDDKAVRQQPA